MALDKDWRDGPSDTTTPLSAAALEDLEARVLAEIVAGDTNQQNITSYVAALIGNVNSQQSADIAALTTRVTALEGGAPPAPTYPYSSTVLPPASWRPYAPGSIWNTPLTRAVAVSKIVPSEDVAMVSHWSTSMLEAGWNRSTIKTGPTSDYHHPVVWSKPSDPNYVVHLDDQWRIDYGADLTMGGAALNIPNGTYAAQGGYIAYHDANASTGDGHLAIMNQANGYEYDFWQVQNSTATDAPQTGFSGGGTVWATEGGKLSMTGSGTGVGGGQGGATAAAFGLAAGLVRGAELTAGLIDHALFTVSYRVRSPTMTPAVGSASTDNTQLWPHLGQRIWLDATPAEIDSWAVTYGWHAWEKMLWKAFNKYGCFVGDTGGGALKTESRSQFQAFSIANPLETYAAAHIGDANSHITGSAGNYTFNFSGSLGVLAYIGRFHWLNP